MTNEIKNWVLRLSMLWGLLLVGLLPLAVEAPAQPSGALTNEHGFDSTLLWQALAVFAVLVLGLVFWNRRLAAEIASRKRAEAALHRQTGELAALNSLGRAVNATLAWEATAKAGLEGMLRAVRPDLAFLFLRDGERLVLADALPPAARPRLGDAPKHRVGECICGLAVQAKKPIFSADNNLDPRCSLEECRRAGIRSFAALPLIRGEEIIGVIGLASDTQRDFKLEAGFLETLASQVSAALSNARLFETAQRELATRQHAEKAMQSTQMRLSAILNNIPDITWLKDSDSRFIAVNEAFARAAGYAAADLVGKTDVDIWPSHLAESYREDDRHVMRAREQKRIEERMVDSAGNESWIETIKNPIMDEAGAVIGTTGIARDITERKLAEEALRKSEHQLRLLTDNMVDAISQINAERMVVYCSPSVERVFGIKQAALIGRNAYERVHPDDTERLRQQALGFIAAQAAWFRAEYRYLHGRGDYVWVESTIRLLFDENRAYAGAVLGSRDITEKKIAEQRLRENEEALRQANLVIENSPAVVFRWRAAEGWPVALVSQNVSQFGYAPEELLSGAVPFAAMVHPEDLDRVGREVREYSASGAVRFQQEYRIVTKDGRVRWVDDRTLVERNPDGQITFYQGIVIDITERKQAEEELKRQTTLFRNLFASSPQAIAVLDHEDRVLEVNRSFEALFGYSETEARGRLINDLVAPAPFLEDAESISRAVLDGSRIVEKETIRCAKDGRPVDVFVIGWPIVVDQRLIGAYGIYRDIRQRKRAEELLRFTQFAVDRMGDAAFWMGPDARLVYVNDAACRALGRPRDELLTMTVHDFDPMFPAESWSDHWQELKAKGSLTFETLHRATDGREYPVEIRANFLEFSGKEYNIAFVTDITERKRAEEALRSSLEEKDSLLTEVHHRVKNTLQVISSLLNLQARQTDNVEVHSLLRDTQNRVSSMAILHEILYTSGNLDRIRFPQYMQSICAHLARSYGSDARSIKLKQEIAEVSLGMDQAVPTGLIINELVSNAFKHAFPGRADGEIVVAVRMADEQRLLLRVADNGAGMAAGREAQPPETLGLRLVDNLVRQLDGKMTVSSGPGAVFQIVFPVRSSERSRA